MHGKEEKAAQRSGTVVASIRDSAAKKVLRQSVGELRFVSSPRKLPLSDGKSPSLYVFQISADELPATVELMAGLRRQRPLTDILIWMPRAKGGDVRACFRGGAKDVVVSQSAAALASAISETLDAQKLLPRVNDLSSQRSKSSRFESMLSRSQAVWDLFELCSRVAPTEATVLIVGDTGTGKELMARALHRRSKRPGRFVAANCASIPPDLITSELFGHEKGAFTGADRAKQGLVTHAHQGTLFLDEVGDMSQEGQQSLLRMLQEKRIRPVGSLVETQIDVRVVAATNVPLDDAVRKGDFREDLFYRLDVIRMNIPPLRRRPEDILFLFGHFVKKLSKHYGVDVPIYRESFLDALTAFAWPGNVRQLENLSERLVLARPNRPLTSRDFDKLLNTSLADGPPADASKAELGDKLISIDPAKTMRENVEPVVQAIEKAYVQSVLQHTAGHITEAAQIAGVNRRTLLRKLQAYRIDKRQFKRSASDVF